MSPSVPGLPTTTQPSAAAPTGVPPSGRVGLLVRALIAVGLVLGWVQLAHTPAERSLGDLLHALQNGRVDGITVERPPPGAQGPFAVEWQGPVRPAFAYYLHGQPDGEQTFADEAGIPPPPSPGELDWIVELAERSGVPVVERDVSPPPSGVQVHWQLAVTASLAGLVLLVAGPQPRLATKWAWFWLTVAAPVAWLAFVLVEPTPWGRRAPRRRVRRLTGGRAFFLALVLATLLSAIPWYADLFPR